MTPQTDPDDDALTGEGRLEPELEWSALSAGRRFATVPFTLSDAVVDAYLDATGEHHPLYAREGAGWAPALLPTVVRLAKRSLGGRWPSGTIQLDHHVATHRPLRRGEPLTMDTRIGLVEVRNGRSYFETVSTLRDAHAHVIGEQTSNSMWAGARPADAATRGPDADTPNAASGGPPARQAPAPVPERPTPTFGPVSATYSLDTLRAFGRVAGALDPIHVDPDFGRATRFGTNIAQGRLVMTLLSRLMLERFGEAWLQGSELSVRFLKPVLAGRRVCAWGASDPAADGAFRVWCEDDTGQTVISGRARPGPPVAGGNRP